MSSYKAAMARTTQIIDRRARYFRNQIVLVVLVGLCSTGVALATRTPAPLAALLFLFPICGFFSLLDAQLLNTWRTGLLAVWTERELDLWGFREAMGAMPTLPKATLQGMLDTLPSTPDWAMERAASATTRVAVAAVVTAVDTCHADAIAVKTVGSAVAAVAVVCAAALSDGRPLLLAGAILVLPALARWGRARRLRALEASTAGNRREEDFSAEAYQGLVRNLDWAALSTEERTALATTVGPPVPAVPDGR